VAAINDFGLSREWILMCINIVAEDAIESTRALMDTIGTEAGAWATCGASVERGTEDGYVVSFEAGVNGRIAINVWNICKCDE
jgi:hypothetical protein